MRTGDLDSIPLPEERGPVGWARYLLRLSVALHEQGDTVTAPVLGRAAVWLCKQEGIPLRLVLPVLPGSTEEN